MLGRVWESRQLQLEAEVAVDTRVGFRASALRFCYTRLETCTWRSSDRALLFLVDSLKLSWGARDHLQRFWFYTSLLK